MSHSALDWGAQQVRAGRASSFVMRPRTGGIRYALLLGPGFGGDKRPGYMGTIEYTQNDYLHIWSGLLNVPGLPTVCLGCEEGGEFLKDQLVAESFPWDDAS
jgi:hypothetical protein